MPLGFDGVVAAVDAAGDRRAQPAAGRGALRAEVRRLGDDRGGDVLRQRRGGARRRRDRRALAGLGVGRGARDAVGVADERDQELLVLAEREVGAEAVPRGERRHRDAVEAGDRVGGLAGLDAVAHRVDQRVGLAVLERVVGRGAAVDGGGDARGQRLGADAGGVEPGRGARHAVGQQQHLAGTQQVVLGQGVAPRELGGRGADAAGDAGERVAVLRDGDLVGGVGDDAARIGLEVRHRRRRRRRVRRRGVVAAEGFWKPPHPARATAPASSSACAGPRRPCRGAIASPMLSTLHILRVCPSPIRPVPPLRQGARSARRRGRCIQAHGRS